MVHEAILILMSQLYLGLFTSNILKLTYGVLVTDCSVSSSFNCRCAVALHRMAHVGAYSARATRAQRSAFTTLDRRPLQ